MFRKKIGVIIALFATMSLALYGCKGEKAEEQNQTDSNISSGEITSGGSATVGIALDLDSLDPHNMVYAGTREVLFNVFEGLVKPNSDGDLIPAVASEYTISDDATVYTFKLREEIGRAHV